MAISEKRLRSLVDRLFLIMKPKGVSEIKYKMNHLYKNEYYFWIIYVVPDDSKFLDYDSARHFREVWNKELKSSIFNHFNIRAIIASSGTVSETYNKNNNVF